MKIICSLFILFIQFPFCGQATPVPDSVITKVSSIVAFQALENKAFLFIDYQKNTDPFSLNKQDFKPVQFYKKNLKTNFDLAKNIVYVRITLHNDRQTRDTLVIYPGLLVKNANLFETDSLQSAILPIANKKKFNGFVSVILNAGETKTFFLQLTFSKIYKNVITPIVMPLSYREVFQNNLYNRKPDEKIFGYVLSGILLTIIFYTLVSYYLTKKREFIYYALYSISVLFIVFLHAYTYKQSTYFRSLFFDYLDFTALLLGSYYYVSFTRAFLHSPQNFVRLDKLFRIDQYFLLIVLGVFSYIYFFTDNISFEISIENWVKFIILGFGFVYVFFALKEKDRLLTYLGMGNAIAILFWSVSLALLFFKIPPTTLLSSAMVYYEVGLVMALITFLLGLNYKNRKELIQKTRQQEAYKLEAEKQKYETEIAVYKAQQEERNRISADMHDDLGAGMTSIRLYSELAKSKLIGREIPEIEKISSSADELLSKMNAIIWSMTSANDTFENMIAYLRSYAIEYFEDTHVKCVVDLPDHIPEAIVNGFIRRNVFLVVKESFNNILKHAQATEVSLRLTIEGKLISLFIQDNGKGIDFNNLRQFSNGLKNMKKRMDDVEIDFKIENNNGTLITLKREIRD